MGEELPVNLLPEVSKVPKVQATFLLLMASPGAVCKLPRPWG